MTARERFLRTFRDGQPGHPPRHEQELRDEVLAAWQTQGWSPSESLHQIWRLDSWPLGGLYGTPAIQIRPQPDLPRAVRDPDDIPAWRELFLGGDRLDPDWQTWTQAAPTRTDPLGLALWRGLFQTFGVRDGHSLTDHLLFLADYPEQTAEMLAFLADRTRELADGKLAELQTDYLLLSEPIAGHFGTVISPTMARRFLLPYYRTMVGLAHDNGIGVVIWRSWGKVTGLIPLVVDAGVDAIWVGEACEAGVDYLDLRREYGPELGLIGGIDTQALRGTSEQIRDAVRRVAEPLLATGRYAPETDDRIREDIPYAGYVAYRKALEELLG